MKIVDKIDKLVEYITESDDYVMVRTVQEMALEIRNEVKENERLVEIGRATERAFDSDLHFTDYPCTISEWGEDVVKYDIELESKEQLLKWAKAREMKYI